MEENKQKFRELEKLISELRKMFDVAKGAQITEVKKVVEGFFGKLSKVLETGLGPVSLNASIPSNIYAIWRAFNDIKKYFLTGDPSRDQDSKIDRLSEELDEKFNEIKNLIERIEFKIDDEKNKPTKAVQGIKNFYEGEPGNEKEPDVQAINQEYAKQLKKKITQSMIDDLLGKVNSDFYDIDPKRRDIIRKGIMGVLENEDLSSKIMKIFENKHIVNIEELGNIPVDISDKGMEENVLTSYRSYCRARGIDLNELLREEKEPGKKEKDFETFEQEINNAVSRESNKEETEKQILDSNVIE